MPSPTENVTCSASSPTTSMNLAVHQHVFKKISHMQTHSTSRRKISKTDIALGWTNGASQLEQWCITISPPYSRKNGVLISFVGRKIGIWGHFTYEVQSAERQLTKQVKGGLSHTRGTSWSGCPRFILLKIQSKFQ